MKRKLVLYSDQVIPENAEMDGRLAGLIGKPDPVIGYIPSASEPDLNDFKQKQAYYQKMGLKLSVFFDIYTDYQSRRLNSLLQCDAIHLPGGNTYHFLYWLKKRDLIEPLRDYVANGGTLIGASAGSILMTPEIHTAGLCGDTPLTGKGTTDVSALGLVDFSFLPHLNNMKSAATVMKKYSQKYQRVIYGCPDGAGIIVHDDHLEWFGNIKKAINGRLVRISGEIKREREGARRKG